MGKAQIDKPGAKYIYTFYSIQNIAKMHVPSMNNE
jgi:hypothetical protein